MYVCQCAGAQIVLTGGVGLAVLNIVVTVLLLLDGPFGADVALESSPHHHAEHGDQDDDDEEEPERANHL